MGDRCFLASDRVELLVSNAICAASAYGFAYPARYPDLFPGHWLSFLGNTYVPRTHLLTLAVECSGLVSRYALGCVHAAADTHAACG